MTSQMKRFFTIVCLFVFFAGVASAEVPVMPIGDLREGMMGIGKTVVKGTEIEEFNVEILGVLKNQGTVKNLILVRVSGPLIEKSGGIAQGMSGSPVLINGKLVGAVAYGWGFADARLGLLTPAEEMVKLWEMPNRDVVKRETVDIGQWQEELAAKDAERARWKELTKEPPKETASESSQEIKKEEAQTTESQSEDASGVQIQLPEYPLPEGGIRPLATPLMVSGLTPKAMNLLKEKVAPFSLIPYEAGGGSEDVIATIEPGSAIGAQFVRGDISIGALGTTTWVEDGKVIAFGHPFIHTGQSNYLMTNASITGVIPSFQSAFKLGTIGKTMGIINQDRTAGIGGSLNYFPRLTTTRLVINDLTEKKTETMTYEVIQDEKLTQVLLPVTVYSGIDRLLDRSTGGTIYVSTTVKSKALPNGQISRGEMFYGYQDAAEVGVSELEFIMRMLSLNPYEKVEIDEVEVKVDVIGDPKIAQILRAGSAAKEVKPGETIEVEVELRPYREPIRVEKLKYTIPPYALEGDWVLLVRGGATAYLPDNLPNDAIYQIWQLQREKWLAPRNLKDLVNTYLALDHSQDLIVEGYFVPNEKDKKKAEKKLQDLRATMEPRSPLEENSMGSSEDIFYFEKSFRTKKVEPWIVYGDAQVYVVVKGAYTEAQTEKN